MESDRGKRGSGTKVHRPVAGAAAPPHLPGVSPLLVTFLYTMVVLFVYSRIHIGLGVVKAL